MKTKPLVSVIIPNYNHSRYLDISIQSALNQTYDNIEIIVNDNASTDNSIEVISKYVSQGVVINKNPDNVLNSNYRLVYERCKGKYFVLLCADDILLPEFVSRSVQIMEEDESVGFVHQERTYIDEYGNKTILDPFFKTSFKCLGEKMLPIFMLTDIGQSAQGLIRRSTFELAGLHDTEHDHTNIDKEQWFRLSMYGNYAYIRDVGAYIRVPASASQTSITVRSFYHPIALFVTIKGFVRWGKIRGYDNVVEREQMALSKLANECMGMLRSVLADENYDIARDYLLFIKLCNPDIANDARYKEYECIYKERRGNEIKEKEYGNTGNFAPHIRSYDPPEGFIEINQSCICEE